MSPASKRSPSFARGRARASIASERSTPSVSPAASSSWRRAVSSPVPHPRSTTRIPGHGRTSASRSRKGRARSSRKRSYCAGSQASRVIAGRASYPPPRSTTTAGHASERRRESAALERPGRVLRDLVPGRVRGRGPAGVVVPLHHLRPGGGAAARHAAGHALGGGFRRAGTRAGDRGEAHPRRGGLSRRLAGALRDPPRRGRAAQRRLPRRGGERRAPHRLGAAPRPRGARGAARPVAPPSPAAADARGARQQRDRVQRLGERRRRAARARRRAHRAETIWGTRRVEELYWLYCPRFDEEVAACLEATAVRLRRRPGAPRLVPIWFRTAHSVLDRCGLAALAGNRVEVRGPARLEFRSTSATRSLRVEASCDPRTLAGYVYRDPAGWDVHVAQSDIASVTLELRRRPHPLAAWRPPRRLTCSEGAALELHAPEPLPGVRYLAWDATGA